MGRTRSATRYARVWLRGAAALVSGRGLMHAVITYLITAGLVISEIGNFNPGEEMIVLASTTQAIVGNTYDRATFVTPNGVAAKVIFQVVP